jgi:pilus assembly protein Flp/PilA
MLKKIASFIRQEEGVTATEYALMIALVAVAIIVGAGLLGTNLNTVFSSIATRI